MKTLIKNGTIYRNGTFQKQDILLENDLITTVEAGLAQSVENTLAADDRVIDATGLHVMPGFVDLHAHLRDPGQTHKEDIVTGTRAAAHGGFTTVCAMPNTDPVVDNIATVEYIKRKAHDLGSCKVLVIGALTKKSEGKEIAETASMLEGGIVAVSDDGGCVQNARLMLNSMKYVSSFDLPIIIHAEDYDLAGKGQINGGRMAAKLGLSGISGLAEEIMIARDIMLAESAKCRLHIAHISTAKSIRLLREARERGVKVTAEVTPHHLLLTDDACEFFDTNTKVKPPLRADKDRLACLEALKEGLIGMIATDHAPHSDYEKEREFLLAPFGINGFETAFVSLYDRLVVPGHLTLEMLVERMAVNPAEFLKLNCGVIEPGRDADIVLVDLNGETAITPETMLSRAKNTPFIGTTFKSRVKTTLCGGKITYSENAEA
jgi:dihydroorotase